MDFIKTFYWTIQFKQQKNIFDEEKVISILEQIERYVPSFNDYGKYIDKEIVKYYLRTNRNKGRLEISSDSIDFYFDISESNIDWFDYPKIIFDIIFSSGIVLPLSIDYIKRSSITTFSTIVNHGEILFNLFSKDNEFKDLIGVNKIMSYKPEFYILLNKNDSIYNNITFRSDSSIIEDMEENYLKSEELIVWFEIIKHRGFNPNFNFSETFYNISEYFEGDMYKNYMSSIEKPIFDYIKTKEDLLIKNK